MALKFLNKKGWHTGSLRNIENVWKAEQKHDQEQKKLEELRKQIQEEREKSEFRLLQEQAGLVPKQERLDFLYDSGLACGKSSASDGFKALEALPTKPEPDATTAASSKQPGALFEEKPQSANDAWRKLHSDPLLMIRQREQEALSRIKNNPVQMAMIRNSVQGKKEGKKHKKDKRKKKHSQDSGSEEEGRKERTHWDDKNERKEHKKPSYKSNQYPSDSQDPASEGEERKMPIHREDKNPVGRKGDEKMKKDYRHLDSEDSEGGRQRGTYRDDKNRVGRKGGDQKMNKGYCHSDSEDSEGGRQGRTYRDNKNRREHSSRGRTDSKPDEERRFDDGEERRNRAYHDDGGEERRNRAYRDGGGEERRNRAYRDDGEERKNRAYRDDKNDDEFSSRRTDSKPDEDRRRDDKNRSEYSYRGTRDSKHEEERRRDDRNRVEYRGRTESKPEEERMPDEKPQGGDSSRGRTDSKLEEERRKRSCEKTKEEKNSPERIDVPSGGHRQTSHPKQRPKLSEEEKAARLKAMELDAQLHEEQRWKRLKKASEIDSLEAKQEGTSVGRNFLDAAKKSVYGAEKGGSSTIEESVRRRKYYSQGQSQAGEGSAFRR